MYLNIPGIMKVTCGDAPNTATAYNMAQVFIVIRHVFKTKSFALVI